MLNVSEKDIINWAISEGYQQVSFVFNKNGYQLLNEYKDCYYNYITEELGKYRNDFDDFHYQLCLAISQMFRNLKGRPTLGIIQLWVNTTIKILTNTNQCKSVRKYFGWNDADIHVPLSDELFRKLKTELNFKSAYISYFTYEKLNNYEDYLYFQNYLKKRNITGINTTHIINKQINNGTIESIKSVKGIVKKVDTVNTNLFFDDSVKTIGGEVKEKDPEYKNYLYYPVCSNNYNIETIRMADTVKEIGPEAFMNCYSLKEVVLPTTLTKISKDAFKGCVSLTSITIPAKIKSIEPGAFDDCENLKSVKFLGNYVNVCKACDFRTNFNNCSKDLLIRIEDDSYSIDQVRKNLGYYLRIFHPDNN